MRKNEIEYESFLARHLPARLRELGNIDKAATKISEEYNAVTGESVSFSESMLLTKLKEAGLEENIDDAIIDVMSQQQNYLQRVSSFVSGYFYQMSFYTGLVLIVATMMVLIFVTTVIPSFQMMYSGFGVELPAVTVQVFKYSYIYGLLLLLLIGWPVIGYSLVFRNFKSALINRCELVAPKLKVPGIVLIANMIKTIHATMNLQLMLAANKEDGIEKQLLLIKKNESGMLAKHDIKCLDIAENLGSLNNELGHVLNILDNKITKRLGIMRILLSVFVLVLLGVYVGFFVIAIYMPIFQFGSVI